MAVVTVQINNRPYQIACGDGEERHVEKRAAELDKRIRILSDAVGQVGDTMLLVMTGLLLEDELHEVRAQKAAPPPPPPEPEPVDAGEIDSALAETLEKLARRIDGIAERLESA